MDHRSGLLVLGKPVGLSSHTAARVAQRALGADRAGHAGTLDPLASGVLLVGLGRATRLLEYLVGHDKAYRARIRLGELRDTLDREGRVLAEGPVPPLTTAQVESTLAAFRGRIVQQPPAYSAIKVDGVPLYRRARRGETVEPPPREVEIAALELVSWEPPDLVVDLACSKGTYVRSLARDLGEALGTSGTLWELARTRSGPFGEGESIPLEQVRAEGPAAWTRVLPPLRMVDSLPRLALPPEAVAAVTAGRTVPAPSSPGGPLLVGLDPAGNLAAVLRRQGDRLAPVKVFCDPAGHRPPRPGAPV